MKKPKPSPPKQPDLSIVIPAYCEERRIGMTLDELAGFLKCNKYFRRKRVEVIVPSANCPDRTHEIVLAKQTLFKDLRLIKTGPNRGKGYSVRQGILKATGNIVIFMDADLATPLHHLEVFYAACVAGNDIVVGTRNLFAYRPSTVRRFASFVGNILFRIAGGIWIEDSQCGFKMFTKRAATLCFKKLTITGWGFDMELLAIAKANRLKVASHRIDDWRDMPHSTFTDSLVHIAAGSLADMGTIIVNRIRGMYTT